MNCGIYKIAIGPKGFYYGSSKKLGERHRQHIQQLQKGEHSNVRMQSAWDKYQEFTFEIVEYCQPEERLAVEQKYLDEWLSHEHNFNFAPIAGGGCREHLTEEHKQKISAGLKGKPKSDYVRESLRYKRSEETRRKMSLAAQNRSPETIEKIRVNTIGHTVSLETRAKLREKARKVTDDQVREVRRMFGTGDYSQAEISRLTGVNRSVVFGIVRGHVWTEVA